MPPDDFATNAESEVQRHTLPPEGAAWDFDEVVAQARASTRQPVLAIVEHAGDEYSMEEYDALTQHLGWKRSPNADKAHMSVDDKISPDDPRHHTHDDPKSFFPAQEIEDEYLHFLQAHGMQLPASIRNNSKLSPAIIERIRSFGFEVMYQNNEPSSPSTPSHDASHLMEAPYADSLSVTQEGFHL